jgi:hypothetical protein
MSNTRTDVKTMSAAPARKVCEIFHVIRLHDQQPMFSAPKMPKSNHHLPKNDKPSASRCRTI